MREVRWRKLADEQYRTLCTRHTRLSDAVAGALRAIGHSGLSQRSVPNTGGLLRQVETVKGLGSPASVLFFTYDTAVDCFWVEEFFLT